MELKTYTADVHLCTHPRHTQVHAHLCTGWILTCIGPWALTCCLYSFTWNVLFSSSQDSLLKASWVSSSQPCLSAPLAPGRSSRIRAFLSSSRLFEASPLPGSLPLLITGMMCEPWASPLVGLVQTGNSYSFL